MYKVSDAFAAAMAHCPYSVKITLDNGVVIRSDPADQEGSINEITFRGGANSNNEEFTLGGTVSATVEIVLNKGKVNCEFAGRRIAAELVLENEALPMGVYYVTEPRADDDLLTVTACDALGTKFEREYEPLDGFSFDVGVSSIGFLRALCERRGIEVDTSNLVDIPLKVSPDGFTERQIIGFIAALNGGFSVIDRNGVLRIRSYVQCDTRVTPDDYYEGGLEKADHTFVVQWIKCYNEAADLTMVMGDMAASQGIYLESIWMTNEILSELWDKLQGFCYTPVMELSFLGNPLIDVGDIIILEDLSGTSLKIPIMKISHEYDGGVITRVSANGPAESSVSAGSIKGQIQRATAKANRYTDSENNKLNQLELLKRLTNEWLDDGIYLTDKGKIAFKASAILSGVLMASLIQTGILQSKNGKTFYLDLDNGILKMQANELSISGKSVDEIAEEKATAAVGAQTQQDIFNKLTDNGKIQGIYVQDNTWYVNAELAKIINLIAEHVKSESDGLTLEINGAKLVLKTGNEENVVLTNEFYGYPMFSMKNTDNEDLYYGQQCSLQTNELRIGGSSDAPMFRVVANLITQESEVHFGSLIPSGTGNCKWEYIPSIGKTVLVRQ